MPNQKESELSGYFNERGQVVVPCRFLTPYIKKYVDEREMGDYVFEATVNKDLIKHSGHKYSSKIALQEETGINRVTIAKILSGEGWVLFNTADKILQGMGMPYLWHEDEDLALVYRLVT